MLTIGASVVCRGFADSVGILVVVDRFGDADDDVFFRCLRYFAYFLCASSRHEDVLDSSDDALLASV